MSMYDELIPGMANYMEDTSVDVSVEVGDEPEDVAAAEGTAEESVEVQEEAAEEVQDSEQAEMIFRAYDDIEKMQAFVGKYGVDRTFLFFHGAKLNSLNLSVPSMESFDTVGDPNSAVSIAAMEGLGEVASKVWEFIKKVCTKIKNFFMKIWEALMSRFGSLNNNIGRLRKAYDERSDDPEKLKKAGTKAEVLNNMAIVAAVNNALKLKNDLSSISADAKKKAEEVHKIKAADVTKELKTTQKSIPGDIKTIDKAAVEKIENQLKGLKDAKAKAKSVKLSTIQWAEVDKLLNNATTCASTISEMKGQIDTMKASAEIMIRVADEAKARREKGGDSQAEAARTTARFINRISAAYGTFFGILEWAARQACRTAGMRIATGSKG